MPTRREIVSRLLPHGLPWVETINNNSRHARMARERFAACPQFAERGLLYRYLAEQLGETPIDYLEFGVWKGDSIRQWALLNRAAASRFVGFDTFHGLPEDWGKGDPKGTFSTGGALPEIDDARVSFVPGLFQATLRDFAARFEPAHRLVVHVDCDLYSASLFVLGTLDRFFRPGTWLVFDDFFALNDEYRAFFDYDRAFQRPWHALGKTPHCERVALEIRP